MKKRKCLFIVLFILFCLFLFFGYFIIVNRKVQEDKLLYDIEKFSQQDILCNRTFSSSTVSFKYKEVEAVIEDYIDDFYKQYQKVMNYANDQELITLLSVSNYLEDGKEFNYSLEYLEKVRVDFQKDIDKLLLFCTKKGIVEFSKVSKLSGYYQEVFVSSVLNSSLFVKFQNYRELFLGSQNKMNHVFNVINNTLNFLKINADSWKIENNEIQFSTEDLVNQYNDLVSNIE